MCQHHRSYKNVNEWGSTIAIGESVQAVDSRDDKTYRVTRLCTGGTVSGTSPNYDYSGCTDSEIWMTENLDLGSTSEITLDSDDTNLAVGTTYTLPAASSLSVAFTGESKNLLERLNAGNKAYATPVLNPDRPVPGGGDVPGPTPDEPPVPSMDPAGVVDHGEVYIIGSNTYSSLGSCTSAGNTQEVCEHSTIGNHYDWSVATAGSGDSMSTSYINAPYSICPKGWRLPMGYDGTNGEFKTLNSLYNNGSTSSDAGLQSTPLFFVRAGGVDVGSLNGVGSYGYYWSSTVISSDGAYGLFFVSSYVGPTDYSRRIVGNSVRCVAE